MLEPNRNYVIEEDGSIHEMLFCGDADWEERATTSIQEIKNKAIDDLADRLRPILNTYHDRVKLDEIAMQMKGGAE